MEKKGSRLKYLAVLSLLGLLGLVTGNVGFYGFFGFLGFVGFAKIKADERLMANLAKAVFYGFVVSLVGLSLAIAVSGFFRSTEAAMVGLAVVFVLSILTFTVSLIRLDR